MRKKSTSEAVSRHSLFGPPPVLDGEDPAAYDELFGRVSAAVKPIDVIDEMLIDDVVLLQLETLRRRRFISALIQARGHEALEDFLCKHLDYNHYRKRFTDDLTEILQNNLAEGQAEDGARLRPESIGRCRQGQQGSVSHRSAHGYHIGGGAGR